MAYIYQIQNNINGIIYVGKTEFSIEKDGKNIVEIIKKNQKKKDLYIQL